MFKTNFYNKKCCGVCSGDSVVLVFMKYLCTATVGEL